MKILILGAGGVGGYFGARLVQAGVDVTFLVRPARAARIAKDGLRISSTLGDATLAVNVVTQDTLTTGYDLVILTAKAYDLDSAIKAITPAMSATSVVLPLLNGMAHLQTLDAQFGAARVLGGVAYIAATLSADGEIRHLNNVHRLAFGAREAAQEKICAAFASVTQGAQLDLVHSADIVQAMWDKWVFLASLAGMTCLMRSHVGDIMQTRAGERLMLALLHECAAVARAEGHAPAEKVMENYRAQLTLKGSTFAASMLRDTESGGATEADHILGALLALAQQHQQAAPMLETAYTHMQTYAARRAREQSTTHA